MALLPVKCIRKGRLYICDGGKIDGSAKMLLSLAKTKNKFVIPFSRFGGVSKEYYQGVEYELNGLVNGYILSDRHLNVNQSEVTKMISALFESKDKNAWAPNALKKVFISYPREKNVNS